jgi:hypothetical protein
VHPTIAVEVDGTDGRSSEKQSPPLFRLRGGRGSAVAGRAEADAQHAKQAQEAAEAVAALRAALDAERAHTALRESQLEAALQADRTQVDRPAAPCLTHGNKLCCTTVSRRTFSSRVQLAQMEARLAAAKAAADEQFTEGCRRLTEQLQLGSAAADALRCALAAATPAADALERLERLASENRRLEATIEAEAQIGAALAERVRRVSRMAVFRGGPCAHVYLSVYPVTSRRTVRTGLSITEDHVCTSIYHGGQCAHVYLSRRTCPSWLQWHWTVKHSRRRRALLHSSSVCLSSDLEAERTRLGDAASKADETSRRLAGQLADSEEAVQKLRERLRELAQANRGLRSESEAAAARGKVCVLGLEVYLSAHVCSQRRLTEPRCLVAGFGHLCSGRSAMGRSRQGMHASGPDASGLQKEPQILRNNPKFNKLL